MKASFPITELTLPDNQYLKEKTHKKQIYLHHSAGWDNVRGMFNYWASNKSRVATAFGINDTGTVFQAFDDDFWAYHLYINSRGNKLPVHLEEYKKNKGKRIYLEKISVGIEIANWGPLQYRNGKYYTWVHSYGTRGKGVTLPEDKVYDFGSSFRGYRFYEKYTAGEVGALRVLLIHLSKKHQIPLDTSGDIFQLNQDAFEARPGIYTHCSVRSDKTDIVPQKNIVEMLNKLTA